MSMDDGQLLEALLPSKDKRREEDENVTIDNQSDRIYSLGVLFHCQLTRCPQGPMTL